MGEDLGNNSVATKARSGILSMMDPVTMGCGIIGEDLTSAILVRLPVKSLLRFKCVDRSWDALFRTPSFISNYNHTKKEKQEGNVLILEDIDRSFSWVYKSSKRFHSISSSAAVKEIVIDDKVFYNSLSIHNPPQDCHRSYMYLNLCTSSLNDSGVFCLYALRTVGYFENPIHMAGLFLWNPATREVMGIPPPPLYCEFIHSQFISENYFTTHCHTSYSSDPNLFLGLGAHPAHHLNLKLVGFSFSLAGGSILSHLRYSAELYDLTTDSWTPLTIHHTLLPPVDNTINGHSYPITNGVLLNGVFHWLIWGSTRDSYILCFNFCNNQFYKLNLPLQLRGHPNDSFLTDFNGSVACVIRYNGYNDDDNTNFWGSEVWVPEQDNNNWTKKFIFRVPIFAFWKHDAEFLGPSQEPYDDYDDDDDDEEDEIFFPRKWEMIKSPTPWVSYNIDGQPVSQFEVYTENANGYHRVCKYVESITPLPSCKYVDRNLRSFLFPGRT